MEHYEISRYGTLKAWAEELGLDDAAELLQETLEEEEATDEALTEIAKSRSKKLGFRSKELGWSVVGA